jgi:hypothetical protein
VVITCTASATIVANAAAIPYAIAAAIPVTTAVSVAATIAVAPATTPVTVVPGTGTDEEATNEPARSVVSIRGASVRVVVVVAPAANRSRAVTIVTVPGANPNAYTNLSVRRSGQ